MRAAPNIWDDSSCRCILRARKQPPSGRLVCAGLRGLAVAVLIGLPSSLNLCAPAAADIYSDSEALCERVATTPKPRSVEDYRTMVYSCAAAVNWHKQRADVTTGANRQQELLLEATYLYFAAEGQAGTNQPTIAASALERSRNLYQSVYDHAATPLLRSKGRLGLNLFRPAAKPTSAPQ